MPYIQGSKVDKKFEGSFEHQSLLINNAISEHFEDAPVNVLMTHPDHSFVVDKDGKVLKLTYSIEGGEVKDLKAKPSKAIPVIEDDGISAHVAKELKSLVKSAISGKPMPRTQVREVSQLLKSDEDYWLSGVLTKLEEATGETDWFKMYEANQEHIRTGLHGKLKDVEGAVPTTRYAKIVSSKLSKFEPEIKESLTVLQDLTSQLVDECSQIVFDKDRDEFLSAICDSLIVEAQAINGLLGKAEKLMGSQDVGLMAVAHDRLAGRAKIMTVVAEHLKGRAQHNNNEE